MTIVFNQVLRALFEARQFGELWRDGRPMRLSLILTTSILLLAAPCSAPVLAQAQTESQQTPDSAVQPSIDQAVSNPAASKSLLLDTFTWTFMSKMRPQKAIVIIKQRMQILK